MHDVRIDAGTDAATIADAVRAGRVRARAVVEGALERIRNDHTNAVVTLAADCEWKRDPGLFTVLVRMRDPNDMADLRSRIESALIQASKDAIAGSRLRAIKDHLRYKFAGSLTSADAVANFWESALVSR